MRSSILLIEFLKLLDVKFTRKESEKLYREHPHKYNLYGLSDMLSRYNIENRSFNIEEKEEFIEIMPPPYIAYMGDFAIVSKVDDFVHYIWKDKKLRMDKKNFIENWNGVVLLADPDENSIELGYKENYRKEIVAKLKKILLILLLFSFILFSFYKSDIAGDFGSVFLLIINMVGVVVSYMLLLKQMKVTSPFTDKVCSLLLEKNDCNDVLDSNASSFLSLFSWSEIGLSYFVGNIIILLFYPDLFLYLSVFNICALPFTVWSVWYQNSVLKQWCPLCLIVQILLWLIFVTNLFFGFISINNFTFSSFLLIGFIYLFLLLAFNVFLYNNSNTRDLEEIRYELNCLRSEESVFRTMLKKGNPVEFNSDFPYISMGDEKAKNTITIVTNPHCNPCAKMHIKIQGLLNKTNNSYKVNYILTSFSEKLDKSSRFILWMYNNYSRNEFCLFLNEWYAFGRFHVDDIFEKYNYKDDDDCVSAEYHRHNDWVDSVKVKMTPFVYFNGYEFPRDKFAIEDLIYFFNIDFENNND